MRIWWRHCDAYICYCRLQSPLKRHAVPRPCDASMLIKIPSWGVDPTIAPNKNRNQKRKRAPFCTFELNIFGRDSAYMNGLYCDAFFFSEMSSAASAPLILSVSKTNRPIFNWFCPIWPIDFSLLVLWLWMRPAIPRRDDDALLWFIQSSTSQLFSPLIFRSSHLFTFN